MNNNHFSIFNAAHNTYLFAGREAGYLLKLGAAPILAQALTSAFVQYMRPEASLLESHLWSLPASVLFAWFVFVELRLLLLGERLEKTPRDPVHAARRRKAMNLTVLIILLFSMAFTAATAVLASMSPDTDGVETAPVYSVVSAFVVGGMVWALRYGALIPLAAGEQPLSPFLKRAQGVMLSFRLIGLGIVVLFPAFFVSQILLSPLLAQVMLQKEPGSTAHMMLAVAGAPLSWLTALLLNAAVAYAIKDMQGGHA